MTASPTKMNYCPECRQAISQLILPGQTFFCSNSSCRASLIVVQDGNRLLLASEKPAHEFSKGPRYPARTTSRLFWLSANCLIIICIAAIFFSIPFLKQYFASHMTEVEDRFAGAESTIAPTSTLLPQESKVVQDPELIPTAESIAIPSAEEIKLDLELPNFQPPPSLNVEEIHRIASHSICRVLSRDGRIRFGIIPAEGKVAVFELPQTTADSLWIDRPWAEDDRVFKPTQFFLIRHRDVCVLSTNAIWNDGGFPVASEQELSETKEMFVVSIVENEVHLSLCEIKSLGENQDTLELLVPANLENNNAVVALTRQGKLAALLKRTTTGHVTGTPLTAFKF